MSSFLTVTVQSETFSISLSRQIPRTSHRGEGPSPEEIFTSETNREFQRIRTCLRDSALRLQKIGAMEFLGLAKIQNQDSHLKDKPTPSEAWVVDDLAKSLPLLDELDVSEQSLKLLKKGPIQYRMAVKHFPFDQEQRPANITFYLKHVPSLELRIKMAEWVSHCWDQGLPLIDNSQRASSVNAGRNDVGQGIAFNQLLYIRPGGQIARGHLSRDTEIRSIWFRGGTELVLHHTGFVFSGTLAKPFSDGKTSVAAGKKVIFDDQGKLIDAQ